MAAVRFTLAGLDALVAITAIWGGVWLAIGGVAERFPLDMLGRTPFSSFLVPGLILGIGVGGGAAGATAAVIALPDAYGAVSSITAGSILMGWIAGEVLLLRTPSVIEAGFFATGVGMVVLGVVTLAAGAA
jgi:hypothetical protein